MKKMKKFLSDPLRPPRLCVEKVIEIMHLFAGFTLFGMYCIEIFIFSDTFAELMKQSLKVKTK